jgi:uncharacterized protein YkwD
LVDKTANYRRWTFLLFGVAGLWAGCQDGALLPLSPTAALATAKSNSAKDAAPDSCADVPDSQTVVRAVLNAVNDERAKHQLAPLRIDPELSAAAGFYACRLVEGGFFSHEDPFDGSTVDVRVANFGYAFRKVGENLAAGQRSVDAVMSDWMASPEHRANILDPAYTDIGIGVKLGGECGIYWVQEFGRPLVAPEVASSKAADREPAGATKPDLTSKPAEQTAPASSPSESHLE